MIWYETGKVIAAFGVKPTLSVQWQRDNFWLYGIIEPLSGWQFNQEYPHFDTEHFQYFIDALSKQLGKDIALIQLDQAGAHMTSALRWAENLIPIAQPAHSPELNPIERVLAIYQGSTERGMLSNPWTFAAASNANTGTNYG